MAISITRHTVGHRDYFGEQLASAITVADAAVSAALTGGFYRIAATTNSVVRIGEGLANANGGFYMAAGSVECVKVPQGFVIACNAG